MNIVTCGVDNNFMDSLVRGIILEMVNEGTLQAQLLDCEGTPLGKNAKVLLCCEGDCGDNKPEDKDTFVDKVTNEVVGGNHKITLTRNDGQSFVIEIPVAPAPAPAPAEDKYVTDFSLANRGGKPVLELRRSDNVVLTAQLPDNPGGGGGGGGGGTVKAVEMEEAPLEHGEGGGSDGYYYSRRQNLTITSSDDSVVSDELPLNRVYWHGSMELDGRNYRDGEERRPLVDVIASGASKDVDARVVRIPLGLVSDDAKQNTKLLEIPFNTFPTPNELGQGGGGGGGQGGQGGSSGVTDITLSPTLYRHLQVTANGVQTQLQLPDIWFEKRSTEANNEEDTKNFVTIKELNTLAANLAQISWSAAIPHQSFVLTQDMLNNLEVDLFNIDTNQDGSKVAYRVTDRSDWIRQHGNDVVAYPYQIISLFQPGDTNGFNSAHLHTPHPFLQAFVRSWDRDGTGPGKYSGTHAIDIFRQKWGEGLTGLKIVYAGTLYMSPPYTGDPARDQTDGIYRALFPIGMINTPQKHAVSNYASQLPEAIFYRVRQCFDEETPETIPPELIFNTLSQIVYHDIQPHF